MLKLNNEYPGGIAAYVENAKRLLRESLEGVNPFDGYKPLVPHGARLEATQSEFYDMEEIGMVTIFFSF